MLLGVSILADPAEEPVTVDEAKLAARIDSDAFDDILPGYITAAREIAEQETNCWLIEQTRRLSLSCWPACGARLPAPSPTAVAVSYWDGSAWVNLDAGAFGWAAENGGTVIGPAVGASWPNLGDVAAGPRVRVDVTAGADDAEDVRACVKTYIKAMVAHWVRNPEAAQAGKLEPAPFLSCLLDPARVYL